MDNFKNTIVLKNIPSNLVEEAIIVLKENNKARKLQKIENSKIVKNNSSRKEKDYILKEAELVISNYVKDKESEVERVNQKIKTTNYIRLKKYAYIATAIIIVQLLINFI